MNRRLKHLLLAFSILLLSGAMISAQPHAGPKSSMDQLMDQLFAVREFSEVAISPDGLSVAWVVTLPGKDHAPSAHSAIYVAALNSTAPPRRITAGDGRAAYAEHSPVWSPDGQRIAFLSDRARSGQLELYVVTAAGGAVRQLTSLTGFLTTPRWSPDGRMLAILFTENAPRAAGPLQPATPETGVIEDHIFEQRLTLVDVASGRVRPLSPADLYVYEYDWSPDGQAFVATAAHGSGDNNW